MMTFQNLAKVTTTAAMTGLSSGGGLLEAGLTKPEMEAKAVTRVMEMNTIGKKDEKDKSKKHGLDKPTYTALGQLGEMTALKRAGAGALGGTVSLKV